MKKQTAVGIEVVGTQRRRSPGVADHLESVAIGIDGGDVGFALRAEPSHSGDKGDGGVNTSLVVTHSLKAEGFDASEDGTGRGVPLVPDVCPPIVAGANSTGGNRQFGTSADSCESLIPEIVGALSDGAHMGGGLTARTHTREESLPCVSSK